MIVNEDGGVTGSIDVSKLDEVDAKSDEAKAQVDQLKAERDQANAQAEQDAARASQGERAPGGLQDPARENAGGGDKAEKAEKAEAVKAETDKPAADRRAEREQPKAR